MSQKKGHTWDIHIEFHRCPQCGTIIESRKGYEYLQGKYQKDVSCWKCQQRWVAIKPTKPSIGPLIGDPQPIETEWGDPKW